MHGRIYNKPETEDFNDLATVVQYVDQFRYQLKSYEEDSLFLDSGDFCTASMMAEVSKPKCKNIIEAMNFADYNFVTPGNHDLRFQEQIDFMQQNNEFYQKIIGTNTFRVDGSHFGSQFQVKHLKNNQVVLILGINLVQYKHSNMTVTSPSQAITQIKDQISKLKPNIVIVLLHNEPFSSEFNETQKCLRNIFSNKLPLFFLCGHIHEFKRSGKIKGEETYFFIQRSFLEHFTHIKISLSKFRAPRVKTIVFGTFSQSQLMKTGHRLGKYGIKRDKTVALQNYVRSTAEDLGLFVDQGFVPFNFDYEKMLGEKQFSADVLGFFEKLINTNIRSDNGCKDVLLLRFGSFRDSIKRGSMDSDDLFKLLPFDNEYQVAQNINLTTIQCIQDNLTINYARELLENLSQKCNNFYFDDVNMTNVVQNCAGRSKVLKSDIPILREMFRNTLTKIAPKIVPKNKGAQTK